MRITSDEKSGYFTRLVDRIRFRMTRCVVPTVVTGLPVIILLPYGEMLNHFEATFSGNGLL